eukprot:TRINITY_DN4094_c0_g1_i4.p1 TRINITY_DN4094_c0_g1~~TRINITY_DN4094_c0_g1_i4.p1  ORF type:complete len:166 (+),score=14.07 TRINITY_DN4094_c0_g1_i4:73-570(+)
MCIRDRCYIKDLLKELMRKRKRDTWGLYNESSFNKTLANLKNEYKFILRKNKPCTKQLAAHNTKAQSKILNCKHAPKHLLADDLYSKGKGIATERAIKNMQRNIAVSSISKKVKFELYIHKLLTKFSKVFNKEKLLEVDRGLDNMHGLIRIRGKKQSATSLMDEK